MKRKDQDKSPGGGLIVSVRLVQLLERLEDAHTAVSRPFKFRLPSLGRLTHKLYAKIMRRQVVFNEAVTDLVHALTLEVTALRKQVLDLQKLVGRDESVSSVPQADKAVAETPLSFEEEVDKSPLSRSGENWPVSIKTEKYSSGQILYLAPSLNGSEALPEGPFARIEVVDVPLFLNSRAELKMLLSELLNLLQAGGLLTLDMLDLANIDMAKISEVNFEMRSRLGNTGDENPQLLKWSGEQISSTLKNAGYVYVKSQLVEIDDGAEIESKGRRPRSSS